MKYPHDYMDLQTDGETESEKPKKKTAYQIAIKAQRIARLMAELRDDIIAAENPDVNSAYRGYLMGVDQEPIERYTHFAHSIYKP